MKVTVSVQKQPDNEGRWSEYGLAQLNKFGWYFGEVHFQGCQDVIGDALGPRGHTEEEVRKKVLDQLAEFYKAIGDCLQENGRKV